MNELNSKANAFDNWSQNFKIYLYKEHGKNHPGLHEIKTEEQEIIMQLDSYGKIIISAFGKMSKGLEPTDEEAVIFSTVKLFALRTLRILEGESFIAILDKAYDIGIRKNHDYGSDNITNFGVLGVLVRLNDKVQRIKNMVISDGLYTIKNLEGKSSIMVKDEKMEDTLLDMVNYATYGNMLLDKVWY